MKIYTTSSQQICDTITPISAYLNLRDSFANVSLFESSEYAKKENSKSFIGANPIVTIQVLNGILKVKIVGKLEVQRPLVSASDLQEVLNDFEFTNERTNALNGFFGVFGYESIPLFESIQFERKTEELPEVFLAVYQNLLVFDHFKNQMTILTNSLDPTSIHQNLFARLSNPVYANNRFELKGELASSESDESFRQKVLSSKEYLKRGDVFQLVLSRNFKQQFQGDAFEVYRQLRSINPSPYMFFFDFEKGKLLGASPEAQLKISQAKAEIHPIAGTVKRAGNENENLRRVQEMIQDKKENAEHAMLVDLARNDLNRTCLDVKVEELKSVQAFSHVYHMVSKVTGTVSDTAPLDVFGGSFPAGTLSGAPKYRAMELIDQLESAGRGYYGGAIGQLAANGDLNLAIVIRSATIQNDTITYQAGAGIVLDSEPEKENQEVYNKVGAIQKAIKNAVK